MTFLVSLGEVALTTDQVWPDGDAPKNPTAADVAAVMRTYGSASFVIAEWDLIEDGIQVRDAAGNCETVR